jgi:hypothetical protein
VNSFQNTFYHLVSGTITPCNDHSDWLSRLIGVEDAAAYTTGIPDSLSLVGMIGDMLGIE